MMSSHRAFSPIVERPANISLSAKQNGRSTSSSAIPNYELDPATQRLLEDNEGMLFEVNTLRGELQAAQENIKTLKDVIAEKEKEVAAMREKLGDANIIAVDASGRSINYKTECKRLTDENAKLVKDIETIRSGLDAETDKIRRDMDTLSCDSARRSAGAQAQQFQLEIFHIFPIVDRAIQMLRRCVVGVAGREQMLECVQKEQHAVRRLFDTTQRMNATEKERVDGLVARARKQDNKMSPTELVVVVRWMVTQAFESGLFATEENLRVIEALLSNSNGDANSSSSNGAATNRGNSEKSAAAPVRNMIRRQRN